MKIKQAKASDGENCVVSTKQGSAGTCKSSVITSLGVTGNQGWLD